RGRLQGGDGHLGLRRVRVDGRAVLQRGGDGRHLRELLTDRLEVRLVHLRGADLRGDEHGDLQVRHGALPIIHHVQHSREAVGALRVRQNRHHDVVSGNHRGSSYLAQTRGAVQQYVVVLALYSVQGITDAVHGPDAAHQVTL